MTDWNDYTDFLFDERRFPSVLIIAGAFVILCVVGTALS
jgi:hypothetical protein